MTEHALPTTPEPNPGPVAGTQPAPVHDRANTDWATRIILGIVMAAALAVGTWSVFTLLTTLLHAPRYVAAFGCFMFDGAAFFFARLSQRYATTSDSGLAPRTAMLAMICTSAWVNWRHAHLEHWGTVGGVILAAAPVVAELAFEMWHRFEHRESLRKQGRVAQSMPTLGYLSWTTHPIQSRRVIDGHVVAALTEHKAIADRRVEIAAARARNLITLPAGSVETIAIETETSRSRISAETETRETAPVETKTEAGLPLLSPATETVRYQSETETRDLPQHETETTGETSNSVYETETASPAPAETVETTSTETSETETPKVSRSRSPKTETAETETKAAKVSPIGDRNVETETNHLLGLMRDRGSETAVSLKDAIAETGRPKATAAKRLKTARDLYRAETAA